ncbi:MAG TPA: MG2 domain-containing protein [Cytophagaceae bacterium]|nr:MG2 domain-containing protein [Cytophagaceae bacterium]
MKKHMGKLTAICTFTAIFALISWSPNARLHWLADNEFIKSLRAEIEQFQHQMPEDRLYVQFDKPFYQPGESIWFSAYLRNGVDMKSSTKSDIVYVELISPKGSIEKTLKLVAKNGQAAGDFQLSQDATGGMYKIKAYTSWQKNESQETFFEKDIQVQEYILPALKMKLDFERKAFGAGGEVLAKIALNTNENKPLANYKFRYVANLDGQKLLEQSAETDEEGFGYIRFRLPADLKTNDGLLNILLDYQGSAESISRAIPIILNKISFTMYPEGGDLVTGLNSRVAFRAMNEFNKPADVEGIVMTSKGKQMGTFSSFHMGMGVFDFVPQTGEKYYVKITRPEGITQTFNLPEALARGYVLNADVSGKNEMTVSINTSETEELSLLVQIRSKIYYSTAIKTVSGINKIVIPVSTFPVGVAQVTLFDSKGIERAERLIFVNKNKQLNVSITTDKERYLPREKVKMTVIVRDDRGLPMPGNFSLSVTNDQLLSFADDRSGNILSKLLLEQDIKDKVEEPAFYFNQKEPKSDQALDYLLMTSGWRRFTWEQVTNHTLPQAKFQAEQARISGIIYNANIHQPIAKAKVKVNDYTVMANDKGEYTLKNIEPVFPIILQFSADGYNTSSQYVYDYNQNLSLNLYKPSHLSTQPYPHSYPSTAVRGGAANNEKAVKNKRNEIPAMQDVMEDEIPRAVNNVAVHDAGPVQAQMEKDEEVDMKVVLEVDDRRMGKKAVVNRNVTPQAAAYYRARQFSAPVYDKQEIVETRNDFRSTLYWNGNIEIDRTGKKVVEFYNSDDITSFRATAEGFSVDGMIGRSEMTYFTQLSFSMRTKIPAEVIAGDIISIPLTLANNTDGPLGGLMNITAPAGLKAMGILPATQTIMPGKTKTIYLDYKVSSKAATGNFTIGFKSCGLGDAFTQKIRIIQKGFPVTVSFSGQEMEKEFMVDIANVVDSSLIITLSAYPSVVNDLLSGIDGILREPGGCFEQTSMSSYPNAMVLDYLKTTDTKDEKILSRATQLLEKGYQRLSTFETKDKGYEWFGSAPGHEALTAYGLMQFSDMKRVGGDVDQGMMDRTAKWLMSRRDGNGGFMRNSRALDNFGRGSEEITNAYITYSLSGAGYKDLQKELDNSFDKALTSKDPYMLAMMANAMYTSGDSKRGDKLMEMLYPLQSANGSWTGKTHSITFSTGESLIIETTSLAVIAILKQTSPNQNALTKAVQFIIGSRSGSGTFGNTQGTVLALKALTEYAKSSKRTASVGTIEFYVGGRKVAERSYTAGQKGNIEITGLEAFVKPGKHKLHVKFKGTKEPLPYSVAMTWNTTLPNSSKECAINLSAKLTQTTVNVGETVRLSVTLSNKKNESLPNPIAIIGIPAGFTVQPWQLKEMQEKNIFDYYEVTGNNIVLYYRGMKALEVKNLSFDLKAEVPGEYFAPASAAYLYYTNEYKSWASLEKATIKKQLIQN